jgi:hypothetical protein
MSATDRSTLTGLPDMLTGTMTQGSSKSQGDSPLLNMNEMEDTHEEFKMDTFHPQASKAGTTNN